MSIFRAKSTKKKHRPARPFDPTRPYVPSSAFLRRYPEAAGTTPPHIAGTVEQGYTRCYKESCPCQSGELHGPYWYLILPAGGNRTKRRQIPERDLEKVKVLCAARPKPKAARKPTRRATVSKAPAKPRRERDRARELRCIVARRQRLEWEWKNTLRQQQVDAAWDSLLAMLRPEKT